MLPVLRLIRRSFFSTFPDLKTCFGGGGDRWDQRVIRQQERGLPRLQQPFDDKATLQGGDDDVMFARGLRPSDD
jgi:hypothetical protein